MAKLPSRLLRRCEQPGEGVLPRPRFPLPGPARRSPRSPPAAGAAAGRPPPSRRRRRHGAAAGSGPFPAAAHRHGSPGPGSLPPPSPKRRGWCLLPRPRLPARLRAPLRPPHCRTGAVGGALSQWRAVLLRQPSLRSRESRMKPRRGRGAGTEPCRHGGPGPAAARELLPSLQQRRHRNREAKSFVCRFLSGLRAAGATAPARSPSSPATAAGDAAALRAHTRSAPPRLTPACMIDTCPEVAPSPLRLCPDPRAGRGCCRDRVPPAGRNLVWLKICPCVFPATQTPIHEFLKLPSFRLW